jgi:hypothetical protein
MYSALQTMRCVASAALRSGYPQAVPQWMWVSDDYLLGAWVAGHSAAARLAKSKHGVQDCCLNVGGLQQAHAPASRTLFPQDNSFVFSENPYIFLSSHSRYSVLSLAFGTGVLRKGRRRGSAADGSAGAGD